MLMCHASLQGSLTDIQAAPSVMEVDITIGSQPPHSQQKNSINKKQQELQATQNQAQGNINKQDLCHQQQLETSKIHSSTDSVCGAIKQSNQVTGYKKSMNSQVISVGITQNSQPIPSHNMVYQTNMFQHLPIVSTEMTPSCQIEQPDSRQGLESREFNNQSHPQKKNLETKLNLNSKSANIQDQTNQKNNNSDGSIQSISKCYHDSYSDEIDHKKILIEAETMQSAKQSETSIRQYPNNNKAHRMDDDVNQMEVITTDKAYQTTENQITQQQVDDNTVNAHSVKYFEHKNQDNQSQVNVKINGDNQECLLNMNTVLNADQQQTGGTDASLIREEMADQVNELLDYNYLNNYQIAQDQIENQSNELYQATPDCSQTDKQDLMQMSNQIYTNHFQQTLNIMSNLHLLDSYEQSYQSIKQVNLPEPSEELKQQWPHSKVKVVLFDIDETMIHCIDDKDSPDMTGEVKLEVMIDQQQAVKQDSLKKQSIQIQINLRPGLQECLNDLSKSFQLVSFTASDQSYADTILDFIDPENKLFSLRMYRQHCVETQFGLIKDLRIIGNRELTDLILIDNSALSFALNVNNGIPILPFFCDPFDEELRHLNYYLNCLRDSQVLDVRQHNEEAFGLLRLRHKYGDASQQSEICDHQNQQQPYQTYQSSDAYQIDDNSLEAHIEEASDDQIHIKLYDSTQERDLIEQSGEYFIRSDDENTYPGRLHSQIKEQFQCDPIEIADDTISKHASHRNHQLQNGQFFFGQQKTNKIEFDSQQNNNVVYNGEIANFQEMNFVDQPITILNLMGTNQVIEERSNEDEGLTSSQQSASRQHTKEELSVCNKFYSLQSQNSQLGGKRVSLKSISDSQNQQNSHNQTQTNMIIGDATEEYSLQDQQSQQITLE